MSATDVIYKRSPEALERDKERKRERYRTDAAYRLRIINSARVRWGSPPLAALDEARTIVPFEAKPRRTFEERLAERFWAKVEKRQPDQCWLWRGDVNTRGYGKISIRRRPIRATHVALELAGKPRPEGAHALHSCDRPTCVNPAHLRWGTHRENMDDMKARGRAFRRGPKASTHD